MKALFGLLVVIELLTSLAATAGKLPLQQTLTIQQQLMAPPACGSLYPPPIASAADAGPRKCQSPVIRKYKHKYSGIGYTILDLESEACFVPDEAYRLLDGVVDDAQSWIETARKNTASFDGRQQAGADLSVIGNVLVARGFELYIPTKTLGDALINRRPQGGPPLQVYDCDTSSFIYLTVAENLRLPLSLIEITLPSGAGHNYVRWDSDPAHVLDWDTNGRTECTTPANLPAYQGKDMTQRQVLGYARSIRASLWEDQGKYDRAIEDYQFAMQAYPESPGSFNNFAWIVATTPVPHRMELAQNAVVAATKAVAIKPSAEFLDTLACAYALTGMAGKASETESRAIALDASRSDLVRRLALFSQTPPKDCSGEK